MVAKTLGSYNRPDIYRTLGFERTMRMAIVLRELDDAMRFYEMSVSTGVGTLKYLMIMRRPSAGFCNEQVQSPGVVKQISPA